MYRYAKLQKPVPFPCSPMELPWRSSAALGQPQALDQLGHHTCRFKIYLIIFQFAIFIFLQLCNKDNVKYVLLIK